LDWVTLGGRSKKNALTEWEWNEDGDRATGKLGFLDFFIAAAALLIVLWVSANGPVRQYDVKPTDLRGILRYIPRFREKVFILAIDGSIVTDDNFPNLLLDIAR
jgi:hypothetical protein